MSETIPPILMELPAQLVGERVLVRPYRPGDGNALWEAVDESRDHILPWLPWGDTHKSPADSEVFARRFAASWLTREDLILGVWDSSGNRFLGGSGLHRIDWETPSFEIGYWLRKSAVGRGYMTEAAWLITQMAFDNLGANRVYIHCAVGNDRSAAIPPRLGFVLEGVQRNAKRNTRGELHDMQVFAMTPDVYEQVRANRRP